MKTINYVVEFRVGAKGAWYRTDEITEAKAKDVETSFHGAGFIARIWKITTEEEIYVP
uniref:Uncharacterized protein n=1 Tax=viral metagenome TaxID=1070528 RepID=A0A6M3J0B6_9ZZZZ